MKNDELCKYFLSPFIVDIFEIICIEDDAENWRMDIFLDEKRTIPTEFSTNTLISYGFTEATTIQDFPIRGKGVYLHLRRRKWLDKSTNKIITRKIEINHHGTDLTKDFVAFLKATN